MQGMKKIPIIFLMGIFFIPAGLTALEPAPARPLFEEAKEEIFRLNFEKAYGLLEKMMKEHPDSAYKEKGIVLKNILSLGQMFSHLRLYSAYRRGSSLFAKERNEKTLSPKALFESHKKEYLKRTAKWAQRLKRDLKESFGIKKDVEIFLKYPGTEELPLFIQSGVDSIENIRQGIAPTPSQVQNIETKETYLGVLSVLALSVQKDLDPPAETFVIGGKIQLKTLIHYSNLWLDKVSDLTGGEEETLL